MSAKIHLTFGKLNRAQKDAIQSVVVEESKKVQKRMQWILFLALADEYGFGKKRFERVLNRYMQYIDDYGALKLEDAADDVLTLRIRQRGWADIYEI